MVVDASCPSRTGTITILKLVGYTWDARKVGTKMDNFTATMIAEGVEESTEEKQIEAWQHLIDTGLAWTLQGHFGRGARYLIEQGVCTA